MKVDLVYQNTISVFHFRFSSKYLDNESYHRSLFKSGGDDFDDYDDLMGNGYLSEDEEAMGDLEPLMEVDFHEKPYTATTSGTSKSKEQFISSFGCLEYGSKLRYIV
jgi:hypothetical protein